MRERMGRRQRRSSSSAGGWKVSRRSRWPGVPRRVSGRGWLAGEQPVEQAEADDGQADRQTASFEADADGPVGQWEAHSRRSSALMCWQCSHVHRLWREPGLIGRGEAGTDPPRPSRNQGSDQSSTTTTSVSGANLWRLQAPVASACLARVCGQCDGRPPPAERCAVSQRRATEARTTRASGRKKAARSRERPRER